MSLTKRLLVMAGAAFGLSAAAMAQSSLDQSRAYASELMSDASLRQSSLAPQPGGFTVHVGGYEQFRYVLNLRDDDELEDDAAIGFQNARTRLNFSGNIGNENWGYFIQIGSGDGGSYDLEGGSSGSSNVFLEDAFGSYKMGNGWSIKFGQFKTPFSREQLIGDTYLLFADRSLTNDIFSGGRTQGIEVGYEGDTFRFRGAFTDGFNALNTDFVSAQEADFALTARGEFKWAGDWVQANDFTSFKDSDFFGMVGGALHWQSGGDSFNTMNADLLAATLDVSIEGSGWNVFAYMVYSSFDPDVGGSTDNWAFLVQGGIFLGDNWELVGGWDTIIPDDDFDSDNFNTLRLGVNHYFFPNSHAAKFTFDFSYFIDTPDSGIPTSTLTGLLPTGEDGQWTFRAQMQLMF